MMLLLSTGLMGSNCVAALASGGLDSCVMIASLAQSHRRVIPVYVRCGLAWEDAEVECLAHFIESMGHPCVEAPHIMGLPMDDVYYGLWHTTGSAIPGYNEPDEHWEIPGRNLILIVKLAVWCRLNDVSSIALGTLSTNPFPDASPEFFSLLRETLRHGLNFPFQLLAPLSGFEKSDVIRMGEGLPLALTLSCAQPQEKMHCGACGKCKERIEAFVKAGTLDRTLYAMPPTGQDRLG